MEPTTDTPTTTEAPAPLTFTEVAEAPDGMYFVVGPNRIRAWDAFWRIPGVQELACMHLSGIATLDRTRMLGFAFDVAQVNAGHLDGFLNDPIVIAVTDERVAEDVRERLDMVCAKLPNATWHVLPDDAF